MEEYLPWVSGICKCLGANARGFPGVTPPGWPLISALALNIQERKYKYDVQSVFHEDFYFSVYEPLNLPLISIDFGRFGASKRKKSYKKRFLI